MVQRLGGQIPPRHTAVELVSSPPPAPATEVDPSKAEDDKPATSPLNSKTLTIAIVIGIAIGVLTTLIAVLITK